MFSFIAKFFVRKKKPLSKDEILLSKIKEAKEKVKWKTSLGLRFVTNYDEIRLILGYEDTLGMALFIRDYITDSNATPEKCLSYLNRNK